jgi:hypothetical protein
MHRLNLILPALLATVLVPTPAVAGGRGTLAREALDLAARRSRRELLEHGARESAEQVVEAAVQKYGPQAATVIADGGLELIEAGARHGDGVIRIALEVGPAARRTLALDAGNLLPLARELGPEALEIEARSPGLARRVFSSFGADNARKMATTVPAEDLPRLVAYAERADTPQTRQALLDAYATEGPRLFQRIPPKLVIAGGLTGAMIYGTHRVTAPMAKLGDQIGADPDLAKRMLDWLALIGGGLVTLVAIAFLRRAGFFIGKKTTHS